MTPIARGLAQVGGWNNSLVSKQNAICPEDAGKEQLVLLIANCIALFFSASVVSVDRKSNSIHNESKRL
jgi:hypothetical protein